MRRNTGAALVLAIGIVALLLAIGFTFYFVTRGELYNADMALQQAKAEELLRGALNVGISVLNEDVERHPDATSLDHKWRSLFSGAWIAGKSWGVRFTDAGGNVSLKGSMQWKNAIPYIDIARPWKHFENLRGACEDDEDECKGKFFYVKFSDGYYEMLYNGPRTKEWLFYPRIESLDAPVLYDRDAVLMVTSGDTLSFEEVSQKVGEKYLYYRLDLNASSFDEVKREGDIPKTQVPFLLPEFYGRAQYPDGTPVFGGTDRFGRRYDIEDFYTPEWVNAWADVDLNGDGLKDAVWMPVGVEKLFSGVIYDISGDIREDRNDGLDNNLNGLVDEAPDNQKNEEEGPFFVQNEALPREDPADKYPNGVPDPEELFELGVFIYWGGNDGLDNDCDGLVDEDDEREVEVNEGEDNKRKKLKVFLTSPLPGVRFKVDWNADGLINEYDKVPDGEGNLVYLEVLFPPSFVVRRWTPNGFESYVLTNEDVDCLDNDYDLLVNNFETYAYVGPNNVTGFFEITEYEGTGQIQISLSGPPFVLKGFYQAMPGVVIPMYDRTKSNQAKPGVYDYRYAKFAMPGNWDPDDEFRFRAARDSAFHEINHFLDANGNPFITGLRVYPERGRYYDPVAGIFRELNYGDILPYIHITHTGEPICELVGRMAIYIADESGKVNVNYAGGHYPADFNFSDPYTGLPNKLQRVYFVPGVSSPWLIGYGLETRFLPDIGVIRARKLWNLLTGAPAGQIDPSKQDYVLDVPDLASYYDAVFPGYGGVDDNANAFLLLTNGLDDDGDGVIDNGVNQLLGILEGIDEPGELRQSRPYLNRIAEKDGRDNDGDGLIDETGELGDRRISTIDQISELRDFGAPGTKEFDKVSPTMSTFGLAKNTQIKKLGGSLRGMNPLDINYASPLQIASTLILAGKPRSSIDSVNWRLPEAIDAYNFAQGLRSYEYEWTSWYRKSENEPGFYYYTPNNSSSPPVSAFAGDETTFPVDALLKVMQLAVNIVDARDEDIAQSRLTTEKIPGTLTASEKEVYQPSQNDNSLNPFEKGHNPTNIRLRELEKYAKETLGEYDISWSIEDEWWANRVSNAGKKDLRTISYTVSGVESIRITELMVRPVRRLEAEAPVYQSLYNYYRNEYPPGLPLFLYEVRTTADPDNIDRLVQIYHEMLQEFYCGDNTDCRVLIEDVQVNDNSRLWSLADIANNILGLRNGYRVTSPYFTLVIAFRVERFVPHQNMWVTIFRNSINFQIPNVIEFRIRASTYLPRGRYYLVLNCSDENGEPSLVKYIPEGEEEVQNNRLKYSIKYCPVSINDPDNFWDDTFIVPTILEDVIEDARSDFSMIQSEEVFQRIRGEWIGENARGELTGLVFLPGQLENPNSAPRDFYWLDGVYGWNRPVVRYDNNGGAVRYNTYAVEVPNYTPYDGVNGVDRNDYVLCIAFWPENIATNRGMFLNYLEFSQEPDHEYIELTNISDKYVDLSGFTLEIGIPRDDLSKRSDPYKVIARIGYSSNVVIPPQARILLTFDTSNQLPGDKFDHYRNLEIDVDTASKISIIKRNGIGVGGVYVDDALIINKYNDPPELTMLPPPLNELPSELDGLPNSLKYLRNITIPAVGLGKVENVFDIRVSGEKQIVTFDSIEFPLIDGENTRRVKMDEINNLETLAKLVLQGGLLPNYPERDGYDNDGDGGYLSEGGKYILGTLEKDGVDNNLDGVIDNTPLPENLNDPMEILRRNEGVDEGRIGPYANGRVYGYGSYESGTIPIFYMKDMSLDGGNVVVDFITDPYDSQPPTNKTTALNSNLNTDLSAPYFGTDDDPPQWKAFVERRWNPGDCVVVCLYDKNGDLVDGVTYNEYDVINRSIDDVIPAPGEMRLNPDYPSWWLPDCMLWDFYKSLNRKHPEYSGDRFGLSNRWEATDGYYDDWEESPSYLEHLILVQTGNIGDSGFRLFNYTNNKPYRDKSDIDFVINNYYGTPLEKSYTEIALESKYFSQPSNSLPDKVVINKRELTLQYPYWNLESLTNLGVLYSGSVGKIRLPIQRQFLMSYPKMDFPLEGKYLFDLSRQNIAFYLLAQDAFWRQVWTDKRVVCSQYQDSEEVSKVIRIASNLLSAHSKILTVGTAEFIPIRPNPSETEIFPSGTSLENLLRFDFANNSYPQAWVPMFLFTLEGEGYSYPRFANGFESNTSLPVLPTLFDTSATGNWLFRSGAFGRVGMTGEDIVNRWELQKRIFAYASHYPSAYPEQNRPEAVFVWDAEDGVENGDYTVYVCVVNEHQLNRLRAYDEELHSGGPPQYELFSQFGRQWLNQDYDPTQIKLAIEVITDPVQVRGLKPRGSNVPTGLTHPDDWFKTEVGGYQEDVTVYKPDRNGIIIYGQQAAALGLPKMIRVTQRFVALRVRNVGDEPCYLTHIVLAPTNSSSYKINVNTFEPYIYTDGSVRRVHAGSMALPGIHYPQVSLSKTGDFDNPPYGVNPVPVPGYSYSNTPNDISLSTLHMSYLLAKNRIEREDGRYYKTLLELSNTDGAKYLYPLSVQSNYPTLVGDVLRRYEFIGDHVSLRSDVFEIIALVQVGRPVDANKDGYISYRTNEEFLVQSEAKGRIVYERSVPVARFEED